MLIWNLNIRRYERINKWNPIQWRISLLMRAIKSTGTRDKASFESQSDEHFCWLDSNSVHCSKPPYYIARWQTTHWRLYWVGRILKVRADVKHWHVRAPLCVCGDDWFYLLALFWSMNHKRATSSSPRVYLVWLCPSEAV